MKQILGQVSSYGQRSSSSFESLRCYLVYNSVIFSNLPYPIEVAARWEGLAGVHASSTDAAPPVIAGPTAAAELLAVAAENLSIIHREVI